ncbi:hypothetical protein BRC97_04980 [Halobacteriales archaeon QS_6_71_20]|nr:MAG: hypothetical protein BRC97_04980 [Halobacteriales archaeon QS_6_71_20]
MSKSLEELQELAERDTPAGDDDSAAVEEAPAASDGSVSGSRLGRSPFSARGFLLTVLALVTGLVVGSAIPLVGSITRYAGLFAAAFALGLARSRRAYLETAMGGAIAAGGAFLLGTLTNGSALMGANLLAEYGVSPAGAGTTLAGVGVSVGALLSVAGLYFGRDLRRGLTQDIE